MVRTTMLITCLSLFSSTSVLCAEKPSLCAKLLCCKKQVQKTAQPLNADMDDNDSNITGDLQKRVDVINSADNAYLKQRRWHCLETCCIYSCCISGSLPTCGYILLTPLGDAIVDCYQELKKKRAKSNATLNAALMPSHRGTLLPSKPTMTDGGRKKN